MQSTSSPATQLGESTTKAFLYQKAPAFEGESYGLTHKYIKLSDYKGKWLVLFFYPLDFELVLPLEILEFSSLAAEFQKEHCEVVGVSVDSWITHKAYTETPIVEGGIGPMKIQLLSDITKQISKDYGVLVDDGNNAGVARRGTFIIDKKGIIRYISVSDLPLERDTLEIFRMLIATQWADEHGEVCPATWETGSNIIRERTDSEEVMHDAENTKKAQATEA